MLYAAACLGFLVAGWAICMQLTGYSPAEHIAHELYIRELYREVSDVARLGLGDHVHCAYFRRFENVEQSPEKTLEELGPSWAELSDVIADALPEAWGIRLAHRCNYGGREFVHLAMTAPEGLVSVIVTRRKEGERLRPAADATKHWEQAERFLVAGFDRGDLLGFIVSGLPRDAHARMVQALAPAVDAFLAEREPAWES